MQEKKEETKIKEDAEELLFAEGIPRSVLENIRRHGFTNFSKLEDDIYNKILETEDFMKFQEIKNQKIFHQEYKIDKMASIFDKGKLEPYEPKKKKSGKKKKKKRLDASTRQI